MNRNQTDAGNGDSLTQQLRHHRQLSTYCGFAVPACFLIFSATVIIDIIKCHPLRENCIVSLSSLCVRTTATSPGGRRSVGGGRPLRGNVTETTGLTRVSKARRRIVAAMHVVEGISRARASFRRPLALLCVVFRGSARRWPASALTRSRFFPVRAHLSLSPRDV